MTVAKTPGGGVLFCPLSWIGFSEALLTVSRVVLFVLAVKAERDSSSIGLVLVLASPKGAWCRCWINTEIMIHCSPIMARRTKLMILRQALLLEAWLLFISPKDLFKWVGLSGGR